MRFINSPTLAVHFDDATAERKFNQFESLLIPILQKAGVYGAEHGSCDILVDDVGYTIWHECLRTKGGESMIVNYMLEKITAVDGGDAENRSDLLFIQKVVKSNEIPVGNHLHNVSVFFTSHDNMCNNPDPTNTPSVVSRQLSRLAGITIAQAEWTAGGKRG